MASVSDTEISKAELQRLIVGKHERVTFTEATLLHILQYSPRRMNE